MLNAHHSFTINSNISLFGNRKSFHAKLDGGTGVGIRGIPLALKQNESIRLSVQMIIRMTQVDGYVTY